MSWLLRSQPRQAKQGRSVSPRQEKKKGKSAPGTCLVVQWLRICLPMQETHVQSLAQEDPTCHEAAQPVCCNYWACTLELLRLACWSPRALEPVLCNERSHRNEAHALPGEWLPLAVTREESPRSSKDPAQPKIKFKKKVGNDLDYYLWYQIFWKPYVITFSCYWGKIQISQNCCKAVTWSQCVFKGTDDAKFGECIYLLLKLN